MEGMYREWRTEADDTWHASHRSTFFKRRRRSAMGQAFSMAELGPFQGAPRNPRLKLVDKDYSHVRYVVRHISYTAIQVDLLDCRICGHRLLEEHRMMTWTQDGAVRMVGSIRRCRRCHQQSWLFTSHMPTTRAARRRDAKVVL
jgi:hypothetical protein